MQICLERIYSYEKYKIISHNKVEYTRDYDKRNDNLGNNSYNRLPIEKILLITTYMFVTTVVPND